MNHSTPPNENNRKTVVCFGDSITRGMISASYIDLLQKRVEAKGFHFINAGKNNELTFNLLRRIKPVIRRQPDYITIMIGTNDVIATLSGPGALFYIVNKRLPRWPNLDWSRKNVEEIVRRLKAETQAKIALASIPMLGEDLTSDANQQVIAYNKSIQEIAARQEITYLPVYERMTEALETEKGREYRGSVALSAEFIARHFIYGLGFNTYARTKGFHLMIDGVHLNTRGADIITNEIYKFLLANPISPAP